MSLPANTSLQNEYQIRLNRAIDYILEHYNEKLNLDIISKIACLSKYHFHRIFHAMMGETLNDFILRVRLEKSAFKLVNDTHESITEVALDCGFSCSQNFAKAFKANYGMAPSAVRKELNWDEYKIKIRHLPEKGKSSSSTVEAHIRDTFLDKHQLSIVNALNNKEIPQVTIINVPEVRVAYIRKRGPYTWNSIKPSFTTLYKWAASKDLITDGSKFLSLIKNIPTITTEDKLLHDACLTVPDSVKEDRWVNIQTLPGGKIAVYHCQSDVNHIHDVWIHVILNWLIFSDYQPDNRPLYSIFHHNFLPLSSNYHQLDLCFPIKPLYE